MTRSALRRRLAGLAASTVLLSAAVMLGGCGSTAEPHLQAAPALPNGPSGPPFPRDAVQPWEQLDVSGLVARGAASLNAETEFAGGSSAYLTGARDGGNAVPVGPVLELDGGTAGSRGIAWAMYRLTLGGAQPGVASVDVNLAPSNGGGLSSYFVGIADFAAGKWRWHGPFTDGQVRLSLAADISGGADYTSPLGNTFAAILAYDGARATVVGVGVNALDGADTTAPPLPTGLTGTPIASGVELVWNEVVAGDLAGYRVYYSTAPFTNAQAGADARVKAVASLEGQTRCIVTAQQGLVFAAVAAVDISGNRSPISNLVQVTVVDTSAAPELVLIPDASGGMRGDVISLTASGADSYDWDLDGDGSFEVTGDLGGAQQADTSAPGILRPRVRGSGPGPQGVTLGSVSLLILANTRPMASAIAAPQQGTAPLDVDFTGEAQDLEDAAAALTYAWDFDGNGTFEAGTDTLTPSHNFALPGLYNARFRVFDSDGAFDTASVVIDVQVPGGGNNQPPAADLQTDKTAGTAPLSVALDGSASADSDGTVQRYDWDFEGDGIWDVYDGPDQLSHVYPAGGSFTATLRVTDDRGGQDTATQTVAVDAPLAAALTTDTPGINPGETVFLDASGSADDAVITDYRWDLDGDSTFNEAGLEASFQGEELASVVAGSSPGTLSVAVQVLAADGAEDIASLTLTIRGWLVIVVDSADEVGAFGTASALAVINGRPAISYFDDTNDDLKYAFSSMTDGSGGWTAVVVDAGNAGFYSSLAMVNTRPAISYVDAGGVLKYAYSSQLDGSSGWTSVVVHGGIDADTSLAIADGKPAIAFLRGTSLGYAYSSTFDGSNGWSVVTVDTGNVGRYPALALVNGKPAISYYDSGNSALKYAYSDQADGSSGWTAITVDSVGDVGKFTSLAVINGNPAIAYLDAFPNDDLKYAYSGELDGSSDWTVLTIASTGQVGAECSLGWVNGRAGISHFDAINDSLRFTYSSQPESGGWASSTVDSTGQGGRYTSIAEVNGHTAISYHEGGTVDDLKYAVLFE